MKDSAELTRQERETEIISLLNKATYEQKIAILEYIIALRDGDEKRIAELEAPMRAAEKEGKFNG